MTKLMYLEDSYKKFLKTTIESITQKGDHYEVILAETVSYPEGGGQPSDRAEIVGKSGSVHITHARTTNGNVVHEGQLEGMLIPGDQVTITIDWEIRFDHMRWHSAGHILHEIVTKLIPGIVPVRADHGKHAYIEYQGVINPKLTQTLEKQSNLLIAENRPIMCEFVSLEELKKRAAWVPPHLPRHKPLRIVQIDGFPPIPDGGTQVKETAEVGHIAVTEIEQLGGIVRVHYSVDPISKPEPTQDNFVNNNQSASTIIDIGTFRSLLLEQQNELFEIISQTPPPELENLQVRYFGAHGLSTQLIKKIKDLSITDRRSAGVLVNEFKTSINQALSNRRGELSADTTLEWIDTSLPGIKPAAGHLHIVTQAIAEITRIFERIGFTRVRHPEIDWDWYVFEVLNMPPNHPARDELETFFINYPGNPKKDIKKQTVVLTTHTSNGQVREMEKGKLPIRMINIAKCYRRQSDISHVPMFHQFEGLYVDKHVSIGHLKGVLEYFFSQFYGPTRKVRLRPYHFQFTEPSFEVDVSCGVCNGKGCKLCKEGWLELGGAGMVHPTVLKNGGINPEMYDGFAFGWGIERTYMMKAGTQLDDIRLLYGNDVRFLEQF